MELEDIKITIDNPEEIKTSIGVGETIAYPELEDLTVTPSGVEQKFKSVKYGYDNVTVEAVETETLNITPKEETQNFVGIYSEVTVDRINAEEKSEELDFSNSDVIEVKPSQNSYLKKVTINKDEDLLPENIKSGVNIFGVDGTGQMLDIEINDCTYLFYQNARVDNLNSILPLCKNAISCNNMFYSSSKLTELDLSNFDTSKVTNMQYMFARCSNLTKLNVRNWNTSQVKQMNYMFDNCSKLTELDVSDFDVSQITTAASMFSNCKVLTTLKLGNFYTPNVTSLSSMFAYCSALTNLDLGNFNIDKATSLNSMFSNCSKLQNLNLSKLNADIITNIMGLFTNCTALTNLTFLNNLGKGYTIKQNNYSYYTLDLSSSNNLTHDSLMDVINKLYDLNLTYNVANGGTLYTQKLVIGATNMAKLTSDEIAIATNKGWVVS